MSGPGHNQGPTMEQGGAWCRYAWTRARTELLPTLPIEVARRRVRRAGELGIDYKSYAGIRAATGRDIVALLFSSNALRLLQDDRIDPERAQRLTALRQADLLALVHPPHEPARTLGRNPILIGADAAPGLAQTWRQTRERVLTLKGKIPADGVVVIGETHLERGWADAARLAGYIDADRYFA